MDNRETVPGYKVYLDPETGERPPVHVAYLGIRPASGCHVDGVALPVTPDELEQLDRRERNYRRRDVARLVDVDAGVDGPVWVYTGSPQGRRRLAQARAAGTAVVSRDYLEDVKQGLDALGLLGTFEATIDPLDLPVVPLLRRDVRA